MINIDIKNRFNQLFDEKNYDKIKDYIFLLIHRIVNFINEYVNILTLFFYSMRSIVIYWHYGRGLMIENILKQIYFTGVKALFVMSAVSLILGGIIIFVCAQLGLSETVISNVLIATIIQYVGPLVTMMIIIGRSGTAIASEIGNMKVSNEIEALEMMGIDSLHFVAAPRIIGMTISILCLGVYFGLVGILGGALVIVNVLETFSADKFYQTFFNSIELSFIIENIFKIFGFGIIISSVGCYQGFKVKISSTEIPQTTTQSVGRSIILCFIYYAFITIIFVL